MFSIKVGLRHLNIDEEKHDDHQDYRTEPSSLRRGPTSDLLREMIQYVAQRMMEMDTEGLCAAAYGERSPERANSRNGYRERHWETRAGRWI